MTLRRIAIDKAVPLDLFTPNAETIEAMRAAERGEFEFSGTLEESLAYLNAPD